MPETIEAHGTPGGVDRAPSVTVFAGGGFLDETDRLLRSSFLGKRVGQTLLTERGPVSLQIAIFCRATFGGFLVVTAAIFTYARGWTKFRNAPDYGS